jgi:predicted amino acid dehydrogenase
VSLSQYTSVVMRHGLAVRPGPVGVSTGNSLTAALTVAALEKEVPDLAYRTVAVVGAAGNIGAAVAGLLSERCAELILIGNPRPGAIARLEKLQLANARASTCSADCRLASVVVVAVSTPEAVLGADCLAPGTLVCDLSVPAGVELAGQDHVALVRGGVARLPGGEDFQLPGLPLEPGLAYACMAEALLLGMEGANDRFFTGRITPAHVRRIAALAKEHGLEPAVWDLSALVSEVHLVRIV